MIEKYDVFGVVGNGACIDIQKTAKMKDADLAIVLTNSDELNVFACLVAKKNGIKVSRIVILVKGTYINVRKLINPRYVPKAKFEGKTLEQNTINDVFAFITLYFFIFLVALFLLSFDSVNGTTVQIASDAGNYEVKHGFFSNFSSVLACISNVGPAFEAVGPCSSYVGYSDFSTIILTLTMLLGRLEILPVLILFNKRTWKKV